MPKRSEQKAHSKVPGKQFLEGRHGKLFFHFQRGTAAYRVWDGMIQRCTNPNHKAFKNYGARGIKVCESWRFFPNFLADMGQPPPSLTLDRINNDGNYEPVNCRWATRSEQNLNARRRQYEYGGRSMTLPAWARVIGIDYMTLYHRIRVRKWSLARSLTEPVHA